MFTEINHTNKTTNIIKHTLFSVLQNAEYRFDMYDLHSY